MITIETWTVNGWFCLKREKSWIQLCTKASICRIQYHLSYCIIGNTTFPSCSKKSNIPSFSAEWLLDFQSHSSLVGTVFDTIRITLLACSRAAASAESMAWWLGKLWIFSRHTSSGVIASHSSPGCVQANWCSYSRQKVKEEKRDGNRQWIKEKQEFDVVLLQRNHSEQINWSSYSILVTSSASCYFVFTSVMKILKPLIFKVLCIEILDGKLSALAAIERQIHVAIVTDSFILRKQMQQVAQVSKLYLEPLE